MPDSIPATHADIFNKRAFASLATVGADGHPQVTPVWIDFDGQHLVVNTAKGRVKDRNMRREPRVALAVVDPDNSYRYVALQGKVVDVTEAGADDHIDRMAKKYLGKDKYPFRAPGEVRVLYKIKPERAHAFGT